nr:diaminopropionate ammonia-lyase [Anaerovibrio sp. JC8]
MKLALDENTFAELTSEKYREKVRNFTFVTATDGNHGRGVAWMAKLLGCPAWVYLPQGTREERLQNILGLGAHAEIMPWNYDDTVRYANDMAQQNGWVLVQDTAWPGYEEIPQDIMKGYVTMACEIDQALQKGSCPKPTHIFLQAGVGSMAAAIAGYLASLWQEECPKIIVVEPTQADCFYRTAKAGDGKIHAVTGAMNSMMAGLCCGEPSPIAWDILKELGSAFISCEDYYSAEGMRILAYPRGEDTAVVSGESGAVTTGVLVHLMQDGELSGYRQKLGLDEKSRILLISTEGDTDKDNYSKVLAEG